MNKVSYNEISTHLYAALEADFDREVKKIKYELRQAGYDEVTINTYLNARINRI